MTEYRIGGNIAKISEDDDMQYKLLLFDLDGTLLRDDKTISEKTLLAILDCRKQGMMIGVSTSRSRKNSMIFIDKLCPDVLICSGGAYVLYKDKAVHVAEFTNDEVMKLIADARRICRENVGITVDTLDEHYWNQVVEEKNWGGSIYTDFSDFKESSLKICVEIFDDEHADVMKKLYPEYDFIRFSDGNWYKFTKKDATKENAILKLCEYCGIKADEVMAFGDDYADIGMLSLCGKGVAMGNAIDEVKEIADVVIGSNEEDGIAEYIKNQGWYMIKILVVEDDNEIRQLLKTFLEKNGYTVVTAKNGIDGLHLFEKEQDISLLLLDIMLPYKGGDGLLSDIRRMSDVPVIMISAKSMVQTKVDIMRMGADDYITKPFDLDEVLVRIEALLRRSAIRGKIDSVSDSILNASGKTYTFKNLVLNTDAKQVLVKGNVLNLTAKEYAILELMLSNPKKLFSKANLFESVWDEEYVPEDSTLKVHISNLRTKLKEYDDEEYIETVWGMGYKLKQ